MKVLFILRAKKRLTPPQFLRIGNRRSQDFFRPIFNLLSVHLKLVVCSNQLERHLALSVKVVVVDVVSRARLQNESLALLNRWEELQSSFFPRTSSFLLGFRGTASEDDPERAW